MLSHAPTKCDGLSTPAVVASSAMSFLCAEIATAADEAELRALLRRHALPGQISYSLEREPDYFRAAAIEGQDHVTAVFRDRGSGRVLGLGGRSEREVFVDGRWARLGYLSQLRLDKEARVAIKTIAAGYDLLWSRRSADALPFDITTIKSDNEPARRFLTCGLKGLPRYLPYGRLATLSFASRRHSPASGELALRPAQARDADALLALLQSHQRRHQLATDWTRADITGSARTPGLSLENFQLAERRGALLGCLALWDQRPYKQVVLRGYGRALGLFRPCLNLLAPLTGRPRLPAPGQVLAQAYLSHLALRDDDPTVLMALVEAQRAAARAAGLEVLTLGLDAAHPALGPLTRRLRAMRSDYDIYLVCRAEVAQSASLPAAGPTQIEIATL